MLFIATASSGVTQLFRLFTRFPVASGLVLTNQVISHWLFPSAQSPFFYKLTIIFHLLKDVWK